MQDNEKLKVYKIGLKEEGDIVDTISLVQFPAVEQDFVYFNQDGTPVNPVQFHFSEEKRIVLGVFMMPNKLIPRVDQNTGEKFFVTFEKSDIEKIARFAAKNSKIFVNLEHEHFTDGAWVQESWIKEHKEKDKSSLYGFEKVPVGAWMGSMYIESEQIWSDVKAGKFRGFSIEGYMSKILTDIKLSKDDMRLLKKTKKEEPLTATEKFAKAATEKFERAQAYLKSDKYEFLMVTSPDDTTVQLLEWEGIWLQTIDANPDQLMVANGTYTLDDGTTIEVEEGLQTTEEMGGDEDDQEPGFNAEEFKKSLMAEFSKAVVDAVKKATDPLKKEVETIKEAFDGNMTEIEEKFSTLMKPVTKTPDTSETTEELSDDERKKKSRANYYRQKMKSARK